MDSHSRGCKSGLSGAAASGAKKTLWRVRRLRINYVRRSRRFRGLSYVSLGVQLHRQKSSQTNSSSQLQSDSVESQASMDPLVRGSHGDLYPAFRLTRRGAVEQLERHTSASPLRVRPRTSLSCPLGLGARCSPLSTRRASSGPPCPTARRRTRRSTTSSGSRFDSRRTRTAIETTETPIRRRGKRASTSPRSRAGPMSLSGSSRKASTKAKCRG